MVVNKKTMTKQEFRRSWMMEATNQPGMILDVLRLNGLRLMLKKRTMTKKVS